MVSSSGLMPVLFEWVSSFETHIFISLPVQLNFIIKYMHVYNKSYSKWCDSNLENPHV